MFARLSLLVDRLRDLADLIIRAAWTGAMGFGAAAVVATAVIAFNEPVGFGWRFFGWWLVAALLFVPAAVVWWFAWNARLLRTTIGELPQRLTTLADDAVDELIGVASSARSAVAERRGLAQLVTGAWELRSVIGAFRDIAGTAAPVTATLAPISLLVTASAALAGIGVIVLAAVLVAARLIF